MFNQYGSILCISCESSMRLATIEITPSIPQMISTTIASIHQSWRARSGRLCISMGRFYGHATGAGNLYAR
jgi:hypothetical protein